MPSRTPIGALIDATPMCCTLCKEPAGTCQCWEACSCGYHTVRGTPCHNPGTTRCSTKLRYGTPKGRRKEGRQEAAQEHTDVLKTFARQILTSAFACTLDGAEVDWTYHLAPWLRETETTTTDLGGCSG